MIKLCSRRAMALKISCSSTSIQDVGSKKRKHGGVKSKLFCHPSPPKGLRKGGGEDPEPLLRFFTTWGVLVERVMFVLLMNRMR